MQSLETKSSRPRPKSFETEARPETFETETRKSWSWDVSRDRVSRFHHWWGSYALATSVWRGSHCVMVPLRPSKK